MSNVMLAMVGPVGWGLLVLMGVLLCLVLGVRLTALSANAAITSRGAGLLIPYKVKGSSHIYRGSLVGLSSGYARALVAGDPFAGVAYEEVNNTGADGAAEVQVITSGEFELTGSGFSQATVGSVIYASDDGTVTTTSTSNSKIGRCTRYISATKIAVLIDPIQA